MFRFNISEDVFIISIYLSCAISNKSLTTHNRLFYILVWTAKHCTTTNKQQKNTSQMVSVYSSDTRFQEGNRFPHPVSVHKLPRYQPDELFPH